MELILECVAKRNVADVMQKARQANVLNLLVGQGERFPNIAALLDWVRPLHDDDTAARLAVANALALQFGWRLFAPILRSATGLDDMPEPEIREAVRAEVTRIVQPH